MKNKFKDSIDNANVYDAASRTPLEKQINLSKRFKNNILLDDEILITSKDINSSKIKKIFECNESLK